MLPGRSRILPATSLALGESGPLPRAALTRYASTRVPPKTPEVGIRSSSASMASTSASESLMSAAARFSCTRSTLRVSGMGTIQGLFLEHPRQGDLAGRGAVLRGNAAEELEERVVLLVHLLRELRHAGTVVGRGVEALGRQAPVPRVRVPAMCLSSLWLGLWGARAAAPDTTLCRGRMPEKSPWVGPYNSGVCAGAPKEASRRRARAKLRGTTLSWEGR